jgi:RND superfamily putative drug exporter
MGQVGTTIALGLLFDTLIVRSFMMPSVAALMGRWFWWPTPVRTRPASQMLRPYGSRSAVRAYMLPTERPPARGSNGDSPDSASTDRFRVSTPHY